MFMEHLALTYKCHSSIGNSLDLNSMIKEVLTTFVEETNAINGFFYLIDEYNKLYKYLSYDDSFECNNDVLNKQIKDLSCVRTFISDEKKILLLNFCDTSQFGLDVCRKSAYSMGGYQL